jgi:predicted nucleic acid-binding protein
VKKVVLDTNVTISALFWEGNPRKIYDLDWINLQSRYDMDIAEDALSEHVAREARPLMASA